MVLILFRYKKAWCIKWICRLQTHCFILKLIIHLPTPSDQLYLLYIVSHIENYWRIL